ncbi:aminoglycoside phosphotransferase family protein [Actinospica sp. MGRD01-02]|uniref:Aminoglycoside phosphotransferase family protein n=1 Tax=Actinospica acidithermotolerans TaxID=2828514 RepID=A0A941E687_9ACTN|nr:phosphotransferase [Actinospica acidithermotolerans]MBR7825826.1 aminoglycoside phosphotransferase family protein [Actinospica acidithermotolerans]
MNRQADAFNSATTPPILETACLSAGFDSSGARLLRHHTNAVYLLPQPGAVVKITRRGTRLPRIRRTLELAGELVALHVPVTGPYPGIVQPMTVHGHHVTFWTAIDPVRAPHAADLAYPLHQLHNTRIPTGLDLQRLDPFAAVSRSLARTSLLDDEERDFLTDYAGRLAKEYERLEYAGSARLIHGDAHHSNALVSAGGPVLADLESACMGHVEWDLTTLAVHCERFGHPSSEYDEFADCYGRDIRNWPGYTTLKAVRELRMITTNSWKAQADTPAAHEVHRRIDGLRAGVLDQPWNLL